MKTLHNEKASTPGPSPRRFNHDDERQNDDGSHNEKFWEFTLYVAGQTPRSVAAIANLKSLCDEHMAGRYRIDIVDLVEQPHLARIDQVVAIPTLVRKLPVPIRRIIGDLSDKERVLVAFRLQATS